MKTACEGEGLGALGVGRAELFALLRFKVGISEALSSWIATMVGVQYAAARPEDGGFSVTAFILGVIGVILHMSLYVTRG